jgi:putative membrane protein
MSIIRTSLLALAGAALAASAFAQGLPDPTSPSSDTTGAPSSRDSMGDRKSAEKGMASGGLSDKDVNFVKEAASVGLLEVELGKIAKDQASSSKVKEFADAMVKDHSKNNDELKMVAENKGLTLPSSPQGKHKAELDTIKAKKGADFDKAFAEANVKGHQDAIMKFEKAAKSADAEIRAFAEKTLPTLKHHLEMAQAMHNSVSGKTSKSPKEPHPATDTSGGGG